LTRRPPTSTLFPYTTLFRSLERVTVQHEDDVLCKLEVGPFARIGMKPRADGEAGPARPFPADLHVEAVAERRQLAGAVLARYERVRKAFPRPRDRLVRVKVGGLVRDEI